MGGCLICLIFININPEIQHSVKRGVVGMCKIIGEGDNCQGTKVQRDQLAFLFHMNIPPHSERLESYIFYKISIRYTRERANK